MSQCNVDFFDIYTMDCVHHDIISVPDIDDDRLALTASSIVIGKTYNVRKYDVVHITGDADFFGIVSESPNTTLYETEIEVKPLAFIFDHEVMFESGYQKTGRYSSQKMGLEAYLAHVINNYHINTRDDDPKVEIHTLTIADNLLADNTKFTREWDLGLKGMSDESSLCITNLYSDVMSKALSKYAIAIEAKPLFESKKIELSIRPGNTSILIIDADSRDVTIDTFYTDSASSEINKLEVWNTANANEIRYYYLYTDKTYGTDKSPSNKERIYPVVTAVKTATPVTNNSDASQNKTFAQVADDIAYTEFENVQWNNLIELTVFKNDLKIKPMDIPIGQQVEIVHNGYSYSSILTGRKINEMVTLCFGTIRMELTKKLKLK